MPHNSNNLSSDLQGLSGLTIDALIGVTDIVESLHYTIANPSGQRGTSEPKRTRGITGLVYRSIRAVTGVVGGGIDMLFDGTQMGPAAATAFPRREAALSALNGVLGDHLAESNNPLAIPMQLRQNGQPLSDKALSELIRQSEGRLAVLVHGSCLNDLQWHRQGHNHGLSLAQDLGFAPVYLHYNSGLHVSENGRKLSNLLQTIAAKSPYPLEIVIIGHSMGGLVARSACYYGNRSGCSWLQQLRKLLFLGTPHHGAPLEKGGNQIDAILQSSPYSAPFARLGKIRSSGITDMRYGSLLEADWQGRDRFAFFGDQRTLLPLPHNVQCYAIAASRSKDSNKRSDELSGDGLVPVNSALGRHKYPEKDLRFPDSHQWIARGINHMDLLSHAEVYAVIKKWLAT